uniref:Ventral homeobox n=1 Tax=Neogobius melanostomus TaxID=47308 RepID=A0A8C6WXD6_9GOBI
MVKFFSVDWLAQSHFDSSCEARDQLESEMDTTFKPHVPCMVQPSAPSYGKGYLQPKPKTAQNAEHTVKTSVQSGLCSPRSSFSETSEYFSGYESEAASSEYSASDDVEKDAQNQRRVRTKFTQEQINKLEKIFHKHKYLDAGERVKTIAEKLSLSETQVKTWFQNRRMKLKREVQDMRTEFLAVPAALLPPMMLQHHAHLGQLPGVNGSMYPLQEVHRAAAHPAMPRHHPYHPYQALHALPAHRVIPAFY